MPNEVKPIAEGSKSVEKTSITHAEYVQRRSARPEPKEATKAEPEGKEPETPKEAVKEAKDEVKEAKKAEAEQKEVLSKELDIENLTDEEIQELAQKGKSGLLKRVAELTAKRKLAEERAAQLEAALQQKASDPLKSEKKEKNPYADLDSLDKLRAKTAEVEEVIEWAEDILFQYDGAPADDVVAQIQGKDVTKAQVRKALKDAQKARKEYLPEQLAELQKKESRKALKKQNEELARKELPWMGDDTNEIKQKYEALRSDPLLRKAIEAVPDLEPYMEYMAAHAANSVYGRKSLSLDAPKIKATPPSNPGTTAAKTEGPTGRESGQLKELEARFKKTGSARDFEALRTAQLSKRQPISL